MGSRINWSCFPPSSDPRMLMVPPPSIIHGQGDALSLQALGQLWTSATDTRSWQRTGIPPGRKRKDKRRMCRFILHVQQNIILEGHLLLSVFKVYRKNSLCRMAWHSALRAGVRGAGPLCPPSSWGFIFYIRSNVACKPLIVWLLTFLLTVGFLLKGQHYISNLWSM